MEYILFFIMLVGTVYILTTDNIRTIRYYVARYIYLFSFWLIGIYNSVKPEAGLDQNNLLFSKAILSDHVPKDQIFIANSEMSKSAFLISPSLLGKEDESNARVKMRFRGHFGFPFSS